jgi:hypothetical protein
MVAIGLAWLSQPKPSDGSGGVSDEEAGQPRWKKLPLEGLSYVLFMLLVPANHGLRQLDKAIDWAQIDRRCAVVYHNQGRGAPAYRPQVLFRILVLMF